MTTKIISGCCLDHLPRMESDSVDSIVTDPPYEIGIVGRNWDNAGVAYAPGVWIECLRVLKPGGHLTAFGGARTYHRLAVAIEEVGFEIRDCLSWLYGSGFPKSMNIGKALDRTGGDTEREWDGWGTNLKPSQELIVLARKPISEKSIALNVKKWRTGGLNVDGCRVPYRDGEESNTVKRVEAARAEREKKEWERPGLWNDQDPTSTLRNAARIELREADREGRFPANTLHDGSEEVEDGFPITEQLDGAKFEETGNLPDATGILPNKQGRRPVGGRKVTASASRYFYCAKASRKEREEGLEAEKGKRANSHPTVKPLALMRWLCRLITPKGGKVLDPFTGSGTTGIAAHLEGFDFVGIEQDENYARIAKKRIRHWKGELE